jgi:hypothetical protein
MHHFDLKECDGGDAGYVAPPHPPDCRCARVYKTVGRYDHGLKSTSGGYIGKWYSNPKSGECQEGHRPGDGSGCTWRTIRRQKMINASCLYREIDVAVVAHNETCFNGCPQPRNTTSDCFLKCYVDTTSNMTNTELTQPWRGAFADACPEFKPAYMLQS